MPEHIWLICTEDLETGEKRDFTYGVNLHQFVDYAHQFDKYIAHNGVSFDIPVLQQMLGLKCTPAQVIDTLVISKILNPDRGRDGRDSYRGSRPHSLEAWGERLGFPKGEFEFDWQDFMQHYDIGLQYCRTDVDVLRRLYFRLLQEIKQTGISRKAVRLEHRIQQLITEQSRNGFAVDYDRIDTLYREVAGKAKDYQARITANFKPMAKLYREVTPKRKKDGTFSSVGLKGKLGDDWTLVDGPISIIEWIPFDLNSPRQVVERLNKCGWRPVDRTKGHIQAIKDFKAGRIDAERMKHFETYGWKVNERNLETLPNDAPEEAHDIVNYMLCESRRSLIETQWFPHIKEDGRIHGYVDPLGAGTHRMTHRNPNSANIPSVIKKKQADGEEVPLWGFEGRYGADCRSCFTVGDKENYRLVGCDASSLEIRMLAHYMNNPEYTHEVVNGDIHSVNQKALGLPTRAMAKTFLYGYLYGAGGAKLGEIVGGGYKEGQALKDRFLSSIPGLQEMISGVQRDAERGYVRGLDGRIIYVRSAHAALNTLLQSAGAISCKWWLHFIMRGVKKYNLDVRLVCNCHDEIQAEVHKDHVELYSKIVKIAMKKVEKELEVRCPLDCDVQVGLTWFDTH